VPSDISAVRFDGDKPDWDKVPTVVLPLIYPAQVTWEWLTSDAHPGAPEVRADTRSCVSCHGDGESETLKIAQASVFHEQQPPAINWWLTLLAVLSILFAGTLAVIKLSPRSEG
jgi:hypothetical protein